MLEGERASLICKYYISQRLFLATVSVLSSAQAIAKHLAQADWEFLPEYVF